MTYIFYEWIIAIFRVLFATVLIYLNFKYITAKLINFSRVAVCSNELSSVALR
jgi:hypothetical protein